VLKIESSQFDTYADAKFISRWLILNSQSISEGEVPVCPQDRSRIPENEGVSIVKSANYKQ